MTEITTHVLDTTVGRPAAGIAVSLQTERDAPDGWTEVDGATTDADGRTPPLTSTGAQTHRLVFDLSGRGGFYPEVVIAFAVDGEEHLHVPLLLGPYGYTTYRGS